MKSILKIFLLIIGINLNVDAQQLSANETLKKVETYYKSMKELDFEMEYKMYKGYVGNQVTESYTGSIYKNEDFTKIKILGSEIVLFQDKQLTINNKDKTIIYKDTKENAMQKSPMDISTFLKFFNESDTKINGRTIIHEMILKNIQLPIPYNKIVIHVNTDTYEIEKQVLYLATKVPFKTDDGKETSDMARMEINFKQNRKAVNKLLKLNDYILLGKNNEVQLANAYASYTLINQTNFK